MGAKITWPKSDAASTSSKTSQSTTQGSLKGKAKVTWPKADTVSSSSDKKTKVTAQTKSSTSTAGSSNRSGAGRKQVLEGIHASGAADSGDYSALLKLAETSVSNAQKKQAAATQAASAAQRGYSTAQQKSAASNALSSAKQKTADAETYRNEVQQLYDAAKRAEEKASKYDTLSKNADYAEKSQYRSTKKADSTGNLAGHFTSNFMAGNVGGYNDIGYKDLQYDAINRDEEALGYAKLHGQDAEGYETNEAAAASYKQQLDAAESALDAAKQKSKAAQQAVKNAQTFSTPEDEMEQLESARIAAESAVAAAQREYDSIAEKYLTAAGAGDMAGRYFSDIDSISQMTDEEIANFNYLYALDEEKGDSAHTSAYEYLEWLRQDLNARQRKENTTAATAYADVHPVKSSAASVAMSVPKGISYVGQTLDYLEDGKIDQNASYNRFSYMPAAIREEVSNDVEEKWGAVGSFIYQTGMSMGDFLFTAAIGSAAGGVISAGTEAFSLAIMGAGAAADTVIEAKDNGLDDTRAFISGTIAGAAEIVTEKIGFDALFDTALRGKSAFTYLAKNILSEGSEEGLSDIINWVADDLYDVITGQTQSEWKRQIAEYMANGYDENTAFGMALGARFKELGLDMLGGALSGGIMAGVSVAGGKTVENINANIIGGNINAENQTQAVVDRALQQSTDSKAYKLATTAQQKLAAGQTLTDSEIGKINIETNRAVYETEQKTQLDSFTAKLTESGLDEKTSGTIAQSMQDALNGERISGKAAARIAQNATAVSLLQDTSGVTINTDAPLAQVKAQIQSVAALAKVQTTNNAENVAETAQNAQEETSQQTNEVAPIEAQNVSESVTAVPTAAAENNNTAEEFDSALRGAGNNGVTVEADNSVRNTVPETTGRSEATVRTDRSYMRRAGAIFGENGSKAINAAYDNAVAAQYSADDVIKAFSKVYNAVLKGETEPQVDIPESVKAAARGAAELDAQRTSEAQSYQNGGLVKDENYRKAHLSKTQEKLLDGIGRALHARVRIADNVVDKNGNSVNGRYVDGELTVSLKSDDPLLTTAIHEAVHRIREVSPESYQELASFVRDALGDRHFAIALGVYAQKYDGDESFVSEEIVADAMGRVLSDERAVRRFAESHRELARSLRDVLADIVNKIKRAVGGLEKELTAAQRSNMRQVYARLDEAVELFDKALERAEGKQGLQSSDGDAKIGKARYSRKEGRQSGQKEAERVRRAAFEGLDTVWGALRWETDWKEAYRRADESQLHFFERMGQAGARTERVGGSIYGYLSVPVSRANDFAKGVANELAKFGVSNYFIFDGEVQVNTGKATIGSSTVGLTLKNGAVGVNNSTVGDMEDVKNTAAHETIHHNLFENDLPTVAFQRTMIKNINADSAIFEFYYDKLNQGYFNRKFDFNKIAHRKKLLEELTAYVAGHIYSGANDCSEMFLDYEAVCRALENISGFGLGKEKGTTRYSKTTAGMEGRLSKALTDSEGHKLSKQQEEYFKDSKIRDEGGNLLVVYHGTDADFTVFDKTKGRSTMDIQGMFFSPWDIDAGGYGGNVKAYYLNIKNPASEGMGYKALNMFKGQNNAGVKARQYLEKLGYDGVNNGNEEFIAFNPEQIKLVSNKKPTDNPDIRFSESTKDIDEQIADAIKLQEALRQQYEDYANLLKAENKQLTKENAKLTRSRDKLQSTLSEEVEKNSALRKENKKLENRNKALAESRDNWKNETKQHDERPTDPKAVRQMANKLAKTWNVDAENLAADLQKLYDNIARGTDENGNDFSYDDAMEEARRIATGIAEFSMTEGERYKRYEDLRRYLRTTKLGVSDTYGKNSIADYDAFRKKNAGRMRLTSLKAEQAIAVDEAYMMELSPNWPELFPADITNPTDQLLHIDEVLDSIYDEKYVHTIEDDASAEAVVNGLAPEIFETFFDLPQVKKTFADKQAEKLVIERGRGTLKLEAEREKNAEKVSKLKAKSREQLAAEREKRDEQIKRLREKNAENLEKRLNELRADRDAKLDALKDKFKAKTEAGREKQKTAELKDKITRHAKQLSQKLLSPTDAKHIPQELQGAVAKLLDSINQESGYTTNEDGRRVKRYVRDENGNLVANAEGELTKRSEAFRELRDVYAKLLNSGENSEITVDVDMAQMLDDVAALRDVPMDNMTSDELAKIWKAVKAVEYSVSMAGKTLSKAKFETRREWAENIQRETASKKNRKGRGIHLSLENPYTFFSHFGENGKAIYRMLRDAQDSEQVMTNRIAEDVKKIVDSKTVKADESTVHVFHVGEFGERLTLTTAQVMDFYNLSRRKAAEGHLFGHGLVQPELQGTYTLDGKKVKLDIEHGESDIQLLPDDVENITGVLTAEQKQIAEALQKETKVLAEWGNKASMRAYGYKKFTEGDYWKIKSYSGAIKQEIGKRGDGIAAIKNMGSAKALTPNANNAVELDGVYKVFADHTSDMVTYSAWLCAMEDMNALYNFRFIAKDGTNLGNMKELLDRVAGKGAREYWTKLEGDIQNGIKTSDFEPMTNLFSKGIGAFKGAAVGGNLRVIIQQPTAFFRAGLVLDAKNMAKGVAKGVTRGDGWQKALKYSPIAMRKDAGGFDIASPSRMTDTLFDQKGAIDRINDKLSWGAGKADAVTWGKLWNACEWQTKEQHFELEPGSSDFYNETAKLFAEVVDQTQVVDGVLQRANIMRAKSETAKQATSFMGEPLMSLNIMLRAYNNVRYEEDTIKRSRAIKTMGRAATALVVTSTINALAQSVVDAWRDDDKDKKYWERFWAAFTGVDGSEETAWQKAWNAVLEGNLGSNLNMVGNIPFVKDVLSLIQGYDVSRTEMEIVSDFITASETLIKAVDGSSAKTRKYAFANFAAAAAKFFGLPVSNIKRDVWGIARSIATETDNVAVQYEMEKAIYSLDNSSNKKRFITLMYKALETGDMETYNKIRDDLMGTMGVDGKSIESTLQSLYKQKKAANPDYSLAKSARNIIGSYDKNESEKTEESFSSASLTAKQYDAYATQRAESWESISDELAADSSFRALSEYEQTDVLETAYALAEKIALRDNSGGQYELTTAWMADYETAKNAGIGLGTYAMEHTTYAGTESLKDTNGKTISNSRGLLYMQKVYESGKYTQKQAQTLFECFGLGTSIRDLTEKEVKAALEKCYAKQ